MDTEIIRQLNTLQRTVDNLSRPEVGKRLVAPFLDLPGIVGIWYPGNIQRSTGNIYDSGGQVRTLTYNGNPTINYLTNGIAYGVLDGTGDNWSRTDETDLDITGLETWPDNPGLTVYVWFRTADATPAADSGLLSKNGAAGSRAYEIYLATDGTVKFIASVDGTALVTATSSNTASDNTWTMAVGRMIPSDNLRVFLNGTFTSSAATLASIFNSTASLTLGSRAVPSLYFTGDIALGALYANAHSDAIIQSIFQQTRPLFGV